MKCAASSHQGKSLDTNKKFAKGNKLIFDMTFKFFNEIIVSNNFVLLLTCNYLKQLFLKC